MTVATAGYLSYDYRSDPVRTSFCCCYQYALFCTYREKKNRCHGDTTELAKNIGIPVVSDFAVLYQKVKTLIPIALLPSMTASLRAAVSSLEACQTPAR